MESPRIDPEDLFWQQIQYRPGDPLPRLLYADWCDENDRPIMSIIQRWLAATGRMPERHSSMSWIWFSDRTTTSTPRLIDRAVMIPEPLFREIDRRSPGFKEKTHDGGLIFGSRRSAEEVLVGAWSKATKKRWFREVWKPDFQKIYGLVLLPHHDWTKTRNQRKDQVQTILGIVGVIAISIVAIVFLIFWGGNSPRNPSPPRFEYHPSNPLDQPLWLKKLPEIMKQQEEAREQTNRMIEQAKLLPISLPSFDEIIEGIRGPNAKREREPLLRPKAFEFPSLNFERPK